MNEESQLGISQLRFFGKILLKWTRMIQVV